ncbi:MAG TPA: nucleotidyltransferase domain-containing protein [Thermoanaerobaculia bacterium]|nr:nucleotidyltransferase domain-containing protein [Thermoanaerobaculia bacterium]
MSVTPPAPPPPPDLPVPASRALDDFLLAARAALGGNLVSAVLFGSGAEGALRPESDLNLVLVLREVSEGALGALRPAFRAAQAAARLEVMFLLESEIEDAAEAFAVKFADIARRRRVVYGPDSFAGLQVPRDALRRRLGQSLLNLMLRLREAYALHGGSDDEAARTVASFVGPLRATAASILALEGAAVPRPKEALRTLAAALPGDGWNALVERLSAVREQRPLASGEAPGILARLPELARLLRERARGAL